MGRTERKGQLLLIDLLLEQNKVEEAKTVAADYAKLHAGHVTVELLKDRVKTTQAMLDQSRDNLAMERKRTREERLRTQQERMAREEAEHDLSIATVVTFSCVVGIVLLLGLLLRERRSRKALASLLKCIQGRSGDGKPG